MVVGLVLVGKVMIDWGPAMTHGRHGSIDSAFLEHMQMGIPNGDPSKLALPRTPIIIDRPELQFSGANGCRSSLPQTHLPRAMNRPPSLVIANQGLKKDGSGTDEVGLNGAIDCIVYGQYESTNNSNGSSFAGMSHNSSFKRTESAVSSKRSQSIRSGHSTPMPPSMAPPQYTECNCTHMVGKSCTASANSSINNNNYQDYGTIHRSTPSPLLTSSSPPTPPVNGVQSPPTNQRPILEPIRPPPPPPRNAHLYQGETFIINERSYLI
ncbi:unnamed protein product [Bursaphelenchus okinawaensis]|uniref:Uncharacterized protein n=1 Tax=Bursaphelenchus okinawaensis TaxID=465554 RepID=A0A811KJS8_9BILA|nr:unnamed protein product [Bursaphelenchus okinawaensis]CAG9105174.1 unnamed protein product [Bursaphelenchus okinawaensis]